MAFVDGGSEVYASLSLFSLHLHLLWSATFHDAFHCCHSFMPAFSRCSWRLAQQASSIRDSYSKLYY